MGIQLTEADLRRLFPRARADYVAAILSGTEMLRKHGLLENSARWCAFIANVGAETGGLTIVRENMNYTAQNLLNVWPSRYPDTSVGRARAKAHAKRGPMWIARYNYGNRLGNRGVNTIDGWDFRGALLLQHTGRSMALWLQEKTGKPWADRPELFDEVSGCVEPACLVWTRQAIGDLNVWADKGLFRACCNGINRGNPKSSYNPIGWDDRQAWHRKALAIWGEGAAAQVDEDPSLIKYGSRGKIVEHYQQVLQDLGYHQVGLIDGHFGENTETAVRQFQRINALTADGIIGPKTRAVLDSDDALPRPVAAERETATVTEAAAALPELRQVLAVQNIAKLLGGFSLLGFLKWIVEQIAAVREIVEPLSGHVMWLFEYWPIGLLVVAFILYQACGSMVATWLRAFVKGKAAA